MNEQKIDKLGVCQKALKMSAILPSKREKWAFVYVGTIGITNSM